MTKIQKPVEKGENPRNDVPLFNYSDLFAEWFEQKKTDFRLTGVVRKAVESMAWQSRAEKDLSVARAAKAGKYLFSAISIYLGYTYLEHYLESSAGVLALFIAIIAMFAVETVKHISLSPAIRKYYKGRIDADFWVYVLIGAVCIGTSIFCAVEGAKTVYEVKVQQKRENSIQNEYKTAKKDVQTWYANKLSNLQLAKDSVMATYQNRIADNNALMESHRQDRSNYINGEFSWNLRNTHARLIEENMRLKQQATEAADKFGSEQLSVLEQHRTEQLADLQNQIQAKNSDLSEKGAKELPLIKYLSIGTEFFIVFCIVYIHRYNYHVFSEYKILTGDFQGDSIVAQIERRFQQIYRNSIYKIEDEWYAHAVPMPGRRSDQNRPSGQNETHYTEQQTPNKPDLNHDINPKDVRDSLQRDYQVGFVPYQGNETCYKPEIPPEKQPDGNETRYNNTENQQREVTKVVTSGNRECKQCGMLFEYRHAVHKFCSPKCRIKWHREHKKQKTQSEMN